MNSKEGFFWGASTSAHQVEGNSYNNWSQWESSNAERLAHEAQDKWLPETQERFPEMLTSENYISGQAADHYNKYQEDFDLAQSGGHNAHRFSIDWARIEPEEGVFDEDAIEHYADVIRALQTRNLEPFVTLWHWTHPVWLENRGGVLAEDFPVKFGHYAHKLLEGLSEHGVSVQHVMTLNEPMSVISSQYITGAWPHTKKGLFAVLKAYRNLAQAHIQAYQAIKSMDGDTQVGFTEIFTSLEPRQSQSLIDRLVVRVFDYWVNRRFIQMTSKMFDFIGVQYYFHYKVGLLGVQKIDAQKSDLGWDLYAPGLYNVITKCKRYEVPLYVTEDGLADVADDRRSKYLEEHVAQAMYAKADGADVRGYFHWSLMDNFEWDKGFWPRFGLIQIDFDTQARIPRESFWTYKKLISTYQDKESDV